MATAVEALNAHNKPSKIINFRYPRAPTFDNKDEEAIHRKTKLAAACRVLANEGFELSNMFISVRDAVNPRAAWVVPSSRAISCMTVSDLIMIDLDAPPKSSDSIDLAALALHIPIYAARPDVSAVVNGHSLGARTFSMHGKTIDMLCQDSCMYYKQQHVLSFRDGLDAQKNPEAVSAALKDGKALILQGRGQLTVGGTVESAVAYYIRLEHLCQAQLWAEAAAKGRNIPLAYISDEVASFTVSKTGTDAHGWSLALPYFARVDKQTGGSYAA